MCSPRLSICVCVCASHALMYIREHCFHFVLCVIPSISFHCSCVYVFVVCVQSAAASFVKFYSLQYLANNICTMLHFLFGSVLFRYSRCRSRLSSALGCTTHTHVPTHTPHMQYIIVSIFSLTRVPGAPASVNAKKTHTHFLRRHTRTQYIRITHRNWVHSIF